MMYARIKFGNVTLDTIAIPLYELHASSASIMLSLTFATGIAIKVHHVIPYRLKYIHDCMLYYTVWIERQDINVTPLRFINNLSSIW